MLTTLFLSALAWSHLAQAHGTITRVIGANGVVMPGLTSKNTPRKSEPGANGEQSLMELLDLLRPLLLERR